VAECDITLSSLQRAAALVEQRVVDKVFGIKRTAVELSAGVK